jgi:L-asparaginase
LAVDGVVVTHGTDTMEESAYLLDLVHADDRPVVLTGAQRPADAPDRDGPRNLADAIVVAADPKARGLGVLIVFDGQVYAARGTRKIDTLRPGAFATPDGGPVGHVTDGRFVLQHASLRRKPLELDSVDLTGVRVDVAAFYPGADTTALGAFGQAGAQGIVLQAVGAGNANPQVAAEVADLTASGVVVGLSTRVDAGPVAALYGAGGGVDLLKAGAVPLGTLRPPQGRILLMALLGALGDPHRVRTELPRFIEI